MLKIDSTPQRQQFPDIVKPDNRYRYGIPVDTFIDYFNATVPEVNESLKKYPTLCYLLGQVTDRPQQVKKRSNGEIVNKYLLIEGSGMFGLKNPDDVLEWKGIFNHGVGSSRQTWFVSNLLKNISTKQKQKFIKKSYDFSQFDQLDSETLRDFMLFDHLSRRSWDEGRWYSTSHPKAESPGQLAVNLLINYFKASQIFIDLMRVELHAEKLIQAAKQEGERTFFPNIVDAVLTTVDWMYEQKPIDLDARFNKLEETRKDIDINNLKMFRRAGKTFIKDVNEILEIDIFELMKKAGPYDWETEIRKAYCAPSGLSLQEVFPGYLEQFKLLLSS